MTGFFPHVGDDERDLVVIEQAGLADATYFYTGSRLTSIAYGDTTEITNNSKVLSYTGSLLTETVHTFNQGGLTWTVTTTIQYTGSRFDTKTVTIDKV